MNKNLYLNDVPIDVFLDYFDKTSYSEITENEPVWEENTYYEVITSINPINTGTDESNSPYEFSIDFSKDEYIIKEKDKYIGNNKVYNILSSFNNNEDKSKIQEIIQSESLKNIFNYIFNNNFIDENGDGCKYILDGTYLYVSVPAKKIKVPKLNSEGNALYRDKNGLLTTKSNTKNNFFIHQDALRKTFAGLTKNNNWMYRSDPREINIVSEKDVEWFAYYNNCIKKIKYTYDNTETGDKIIYEDIIPKSLIGTEKTEIIKKKQNICSIDSFPTYSIYSTPLEASRLEAPTTFLYKDDIEGDNIEYIYNNTKFCKVENISESANIPSFSEVSVKAINDHYYVKNTGWYNNNDPLITKEGMIAATKIGDDYKSIRYMTKKFYTDSIAGRKFDQYLTLKNNDHIKYYNYSKGSSQLVLTNNLSITYNDETYVYNESEKKFENILTLTNDLEIMYNDTLYIYKDEKFIKPNQEPIEALNLIEGMEILVEVKDGYKKNYIYMIRENIGTFVNFLNIYLGQTIFFYKEEFTCVDETNQIFEKLEKLEYHPNGFYSIDTKNELYELKNNSIHELSFEKFDLSDENITQNNITFRYNNIFGWEYKYDENEKKHKLTKDPIQLIHTVSKAIKNDPNLIHEWNGLNYEGVVELENNANVTYNNLEGFKYNNSKLFKTVSVKGRTFVKYKNQKYYYDGKNFVGEPYSYYLQKGTHVIYNGEEYTWNGSRLTRFLDIVTPELATKIIYKGKTYTWGKDNFNEIERGKKVITYNGSGKWKWSGNRLEKAFHFDVYPKTTTTVINGTVTYIWNGNNFILYGDSRNFLPINARNIEYKGLNGWSWNGKNLTNSFSPTSGFLGIGNTEIYDNSGNKFYYFNGKFRSLTGSNSLSNTASNITYKDIDGWTWNYGKLTNSFTPVSETSTISVLYKNDLYEWNGEEFISSLKYFSLNKKLPKNVYVKYKNFDFLWNGKDKLICDIDLPSKIYMNLSSFLLRIFFRNINSSTIKVRHDDTEYTWDGEKFKYISIIDPTDIDAEFSYNGDDYTSYKNEGSVPADIHKFPDTVLDSIDNRFKKAKSFRVNTEAIYYFNNIPGKIINNWEFKPEVVLKNGDIVYSDNIKYYWIEDISNSGNSGFYNFQKYRINTLTNTIYNISGEIINQNSTTYIKTSEPNIFYKYNQDTLSDDIENINYIFFNNKKYYYFEEGFYLDSFDESGDYSFKTNLNNRKKLSFGTDITYNNKIYQYKEGWLTYKEPLNLTHNLEFEFNGEKIKYIKYENRPDYYPEGYFITSNNVKIELSNEDIVKINNDYYVYRCNPVITVNNEKIHIDGIETDIKFKIEENYIYLNNKKTNIKSLENNTISIGYDNYLIINNIKTNVKSPIKYNVFYKKAPITLGSIIYNPKLETRKNALNETVELNKNIILNVYDRTATLKHLDEEKIRLNDDDTINMYCSISSGSSPITSETISDFSNYKNTIFNFDSKEPFILFNLFSNKDSLINNIGKYIHIEIPADGKILVLNGKIKAQNKFNAATVTVDFEGDFDAEILTSIDLGMNDELSSAFDDKNIEGVYFVKVPLNPIETKLCRKLICSISPAKEIVIETAEVQTMKTRTINKFIGFKSSFKVITTLKRTFNTILDMFLRRNPIIKEEKKIVVEKEPLYETTVENDIVSSTLPIFISKNAKDKYRISNYLNFDLSNEAINKYKTDKTIVDYYKFATEFLNNSNIQIYENGSSLYFYEEEYYKNYYNIDFPYIKRRIEYYFNDSVIDERPNAIDRPVFDILDVDGNPGYTRTIQTYYKNAGRYHIDEVSRLRGDYIKENIFFNSRIKSLKESLRKIVDGSENEIQLPAESTNINGFTNIYNYCQGVDNFVKKDVSLVSDIIISSRKLIDIDDINYKLIISFNENIEEKLSKITKSGIEKDVVIENRDLLERISQYKKYPLNYLYKKYKVNDISIEDSKIDENTNINITNYDPLGQQHIIDYRTQSFEDIRELILKEIEKIITNKVVIKKDGVSTVSLRNTGEQYYRKFYRGKISQINDDILYRIPEKTCSKKKIFNISHDEIDTLLRDVIYKDDNKRWEVIDEQLD